MKEMLHDHGADAHVRHGEPSDAMPHEWANTTLGKISQIRTGPFGTLLKASEYSALNGVPMISVREVGHGKLRVDEHTPLIPLEVVRRLPEYLLKEGDVIFGRKGAVDRSALVSKDQEGWFLGSDGIRVRLKDGFNPSFFVAQFQSRSVQQWLLQNATGTTMASLNQEVLGRVSLLVPPVSEQTAIASTLKGIDDLIASLDSLIAKKRDIKQAAMQQLLTGKTRLPGHSAGWASTRLGRMVEFSKGRGLPKSALNPGGSAPCIHYGELFTHYGPSIGTITSRTFETAFTTLSRRNDVLMPTSDVTPRGLAKASCVLVDGVIIGGDALIIRPDPAKINGVFLAYLIRQSETAILNLVRGSTVFHIYATDLSRLELHLPKVEEQIAIAEVLTDMDTELEQLAVKRAKTTSLKEGMMQQLLTGRIRLV